MLKELIRQAKQCKCEHIISVLYDEDSIIVVFAVKYERLQHSIIRLSIFTTICVPFSITPLGVITLCQLVSPNTFCWKQSLLYCSLQIDAEIQSQENRCVIFKRRLPYCGINNEELMKDSLDEDTINKTVH
jgi:hypothetical protein